MLHDRPLLIVEDDAQFSEVLCAMARIKGWVPEVAGTLSAAQESLKVRPVELCLLDLRLPDSDIVETLNRVPVLKTFGAERVVIVTGCEISAALETLAQLNGAERVIRKGAGTMEAAIREVIG